MTTQQKATYTFVAAGAAWLLWMAPPPTPFSRSAVQEIPSPSRVGSLIYYSEQGFQGGPYEALFIRDYARSGSKPLKLATTNNPDFPVGASWSKDGTLLTVGSSKEIDFIYDFSTHRKIHGKSRSPAQNAQFLKNLLNKHGGPAPSSQGGERSQRWWETFDVNDSILDFDD